MHKVILKKSKSNLKKLFIIFIKLDKYNKAVDSSYKNLKCCSIITVIERTHHTLPVHYVASGMDATVDFGNIDYKFRNTLSYPMYIQAYTSGGSIIFNLYSNSTGRN